MNFPCQSLLFARHLEDIARYDTLVGKALILVAWFPVLVFTFAVDVLVWELDVVVARQAASVFRSADKVWNQHFFFVPRPFTDVYNTNSCPRTGWSFRIYKARMYIWDRPQNVWGWSHILILGSVGVQLASISAIFASKLVKFLIFVPKILKITLLTNDKLEYCIFVAKIFKYTIQKLFPTLHWSPCKNWQCGNGRQKHPAICASSSSSLGKRKRFYGKSTISSVCNVLLLLMWKPNT